MGDVVINPGDPTLVLSGQHFSALGNPAFAYGQAALPYAQQQSWFVDSTNGNDQNGLTVKTMAEVERRIGYRSVVDQVIDIFIVGSLPSSDPIRAPFLIGENGLIRYHGIPTTLYTSLAGLTAKTDQNRAAQTPGQITDAALGATTWTSLMAQSARIRMISGASLGAIAWPIKDLGANAARVSQWAIPTTVQPVPATFAEQTVTVGDRFVVETLPKALLQLDTRATNFIKNTNGVAITFDGIDFGTANQNDIAPSSLSLNIGFFGCNFSKSTNFSGAFSATLVCSQIAAPCQIRGGLVFFYESAILADLLVTNGGQAWFDFDTLGQGVPLVRSRLGGATRIGNAGSFDSTADGINILDGVVRCEPINMGATLLWGTGAAGSGIRNDFGAFGYKTTKPTITGASDTVVGGTVTAYAAIPFTATNGARVQTLP